MPAQASRLCTGHRLLPSSLHPAQSACSVTGKVACSARLTGNMAGGGGGGNGLTVALDPLHFFLVPGFRLSLK